MKTAGNTTFYSLPENFKGFTLTEINASEQKMGTVYALAPSPATIVTPSYNMSFLDDEGDAVGEHVSVNASGVGGNESDYDYMWDADDLLYRHSLEIAVLLCFSYFLVFILGLIGNCFVIAVVFRTPRMRTPTNYFIVNLAVADVLVVVFCLPATLLSNIYYPWMLGWLMCKSVAYVQGVSVSASVNSLVAVSLDRFLAIWFPMKLQITTYRARAIIVLIWIMAVVSPIPYFVYFETNIFIAELPDLLVCVEMWPSREAERLYFLIAHLLLCYLLPLVLISFCYFMIWIKVARRSIPGDTRDAAIQQMQQKSKVKVVKMLVVVVIIFMLSWLPLYAIFVRIKFPSSSSSSSSSSAGVRNGSARRVMGLGNTSSVFLPRVRKGTDRKGMGQLFSRNPMSIPFLMPPPCFR